MSDSGLRPRLFDVFGFAKGPASGLRRLLVSDSGLRPRLFDVFGFAKGLASGPR